MASRFHRPASTAISCHRTIHNMSIELTSVETAHFRHNPIKTSMEKYSQLVILMDDGSGVPVQPDDRPSVDGGSRGFVAFKEGPIDDPDYYVWERAGTFPANVQLSVRGERPTFILMHRNQIFIRYQ
jgi:hypothetical protein